MNSIKKGISLFILIFTMTVFTDVKAQNSFSKEDFQSLYNHLIAHNNYQVDSIIYEHNFKLVKRDKDLKVMKFYRHNDMENVTLIIHFEEDRELLNVLIFSGDYQYYKGLRDILSEDLEVVENDVNFYGYTCKVMNAEKGKHIDGINAEDNSFVVGWIGEAKDWGLTVN